MQRKSLRLKGYDYSQEGFYFITVCTQSRLHLFGKIVDGEMVLNEAGCMVKYWYHELENKFKHIKNHAMVIMPNHIHFIIEIIYLASVGADLRVCPNTIGKNVLNGTPRADTQVRPYGGVGNIVQWYKTMTTNEYINMVKTGISPPFKKRIWQRNYWEHIIRNDISYHQLISYIKNNPLKWEEDSLYS